MTDTSRVERHLERARRLAASRTDVVGLALVGSWARGEARPDSDVDLVVVVEDVATFLDDPSWLRSLGAPQVVEHEDWGLVTSWRVWHDDGTEVEFGITDRRWTSTPLDAGTAEVIGGGMRVLHDPEGVLGAAAGAVDAGSSS